ncbi:hypothetical protein RF11_09652 [Thelohanellus kitauei]|uniref:HAT C-terminal dimerisation domain-containing protein n=1 Tax=Thelohanellus kitauei TaxID=669202 RepID=A0A0C2NIA7_THEKT|nr:hypothetical protein RF11_09652 [Thelohanellus kitauei]
MVVTDDDSTFAIRFKISFVNDFDTPRKYEHIMDDSGRQQSNENQIVRRYISEPRVDDNECQRQWWKERKGSYTALVIIARKYVCTPATRNIITKERASLTFDNLNNLLCLNN